uniref:Uncharacterized protein n=1 Tax=Anguilla anguilla TaxID=7936 RepID=A0A0E9REI2_ANGAN
MGWAGAIQTRNAKPQLFQ